MISSRLFLSETVFPFLWFVLSLVHSSEESNGCFDVLASSGLRHQQFYPLGWLVLCVNLAGLGSPDVSSNTSVDISGKEFLDLFNIQSVDLVWGKLPSMIQVGPVESVDSLRRKTEVPWGLEDSASRLPLDSGCSINSSLGLQSASLSHWFLTPEPLRLHEPIP